MDVSHTPLSQILFNIGVKEVVVCGGARNASLVEELGLSEGFHLWRHFEERAAGFFALGRVMESLEPCVVLTTSGTAVAELLPAVVEAFYQGRALVVVSADRPARFRGTGAPQCILQEGIFGAYAEVELSKWRGEGPLHLNMEVEEGAVAFDGSGAREEEPISFPRRKFDLSPLVSFLREEVYAGLVVVLGHLEPESREEVLHFCKALKVPVLADPSSGLREVLGSLGLQDGEALLREARPGKVLRLGGVPLGRFWRDLEELPQVRVLSVTPTGFSGLARESTVIQAEVHRALLGLGEVDEVGDVLDLCPRARRRFGRVEELLQSFPESEPALVATYSAYVSMGEALYLGNSMPIRSWAAFAQGRVSVPCVYANRGANGIDGQVSTWLGTCAGEADSWALVGDLTALYDLAAPFILPQLADGRRVLAVVNNSGGAIFSRLKRLREFSSGTQDLLRNAHGVHLESWARMWGLPYYKVASMEGFDVLEDLPLGCVVVEIFPDARQTEEFWAAYDAL